jgi:hypothetical protein
MGGSIYLEEYAADGTLGDKIYPGTTDEVIFTTALDTVEHSNTETPEQLLDGTDVIKRNMTISFTTADINDTFNKMAYLASEAPLTQTAQTSTPVAIASVVFGKVEDLGYKDITSLVATDSGGTITYVENVDYVFDPVWGTFTALSTGSIVAGAALNITLNANAITGKSLTSFVVTQRTYRMTYQGRSSKGRNEKHVFEKVSIAIEGDRTLKTGSKSYTTLNFKGAVLFEGGKSHSMETF